MCAGINACVCGNNARQCPVGVEGGSVRLLMHLPVDAGSLIVAVCEIYRYSRRHDKVSVLFAFRFR